MIMSIDRKQFQIHTKMENETATVNTHTIQAKRNTTKSIHFSLIPCIRSRIVRFFVVWNMFDTFVVVAAAVDTLFAVSSFG